MKTEEKRAGKYGAKPKVKKQKRKTVVEVKTEEKKTGKYGAKPKVKKQKRNSGLKVKANEKKKVNKYTGGQRTNPNNLKGLKEKNKTNKEKKSKGKSKKGIQAGGFKNPKKSANSKLPTIKKAKSASGVKAKTVPYKNASKKTVAGSGDKTKAIKSGQSRLPTAKRDCRKDKSGKLVCSKAGKRLVPKKSTKGARRPIEKKK